MKKLILFGFVFLVLISSASAMDWILGNKSTSSSDFCNNTASPTCYIVFDRFNRADNTSVSNSETNQLWGEEESGGDANASIWNNNLRMVGTDNWLNISFGSHPQNITAEWEVNFTTFLPDGDSEAWRFEDASDNIGIHFRNFLVNYDDISYYSGSTLVDGGVNITQNVGYHFKITFDNTNYEYWITIRNETDLIHQGNNISYRTNNPVTKFRILDNQAGSNITWNNFMIYNESTAPTGIDTTAPIITTTYPIFNRTYNDYNGSIIFYTNENTNCTLNDTDWTSSGSNATHYYFLNNTATTSEDGLYSVNTTCSDANFNNATDTITWKVDTAMPSLIASLDNLDVVIGNLTFQFNYSDTVKLFSINITAPNYFYEEFNINSTFYSFNASINLTHSNISVGQHGVNTSYCDASTMAVILDYDNSKDLTDMRIKYNFGKDYISIRPENKIEFKDVTTHKQTDRYVFDFVKKDVKDLGKDNTYIIESSKKIYVVGDKHKAGWMVIPALTKWLTFENVLGYKADVSRVSDYEVRVTTKGTLFESIGDLNCNKSEFVFYKYDYSVDYVATEIESVPTDFTFTIDLTNIDIINKNNVYSSLIYNGTTYSTTKTNTSSVVTFAKTLNTSAVTDDLEMEFYFNYTLDGIDFFNTSTYNQTIVKWYLGGCGGITNTSTLNITFRDEISDNIINVSMDAYFKIWTVSSGSNVNKNFTFNASSVSGYQWCLFPTGESYISDYDIEYSLSGYDTRRYTPRLQTLNNITTYLNLTMLTTGNSTAITITVHDDFGDALSGKIVEAWRYDLATNEYSLVSTEETDTNGQVIMYLNIGKKHRFYVKNQDGEVEYTSDTMTLVSTSYTFIITSVTPFVYQDVLGLDRTLQVPDENKVSTPYVINYTWVNADDLITQICLRVGNSTLQNTSILYDGCSTANSGTLTYSLDATKGYFPIVGYVYAIADGEKYILDTDSITLRTAYDVFDTEGLIITFIFVGTMAFLALGGAAVAGASGAIVCIILMNFAMIIMRFVGFFNVSISIIFLIVIMSLIIIGVISREK